MKVPFIITNFKVYQQSSGVNALKLAQIHQEVAEETNSSLGVVVSALDIKEVARIVNIPVFAQHVDPNIYGKGTGKILASEIKAAGGVGTLLNHSEYRLDWDILGHSIELARVAGLITMVCAATPEEGGKIAQVFQPDYVAVEPPELIGGDISVSTAQPEIIKEASALIGSDKLVVGAGVKNSQDVKMALKLGSCGILLASGVIKSSDPKNTLKQLVQGLI